MLIDKITTGFVVQVFDTEKKEYVSQEFIAGSETEYETNDGYNLNEYQEQEMLDAGFGPYAEKEPYLPFDMVQPIKAANG